MRRYTATVLLALLACIVMAIPAVRPADFLSRSERAQLSSLPLRSTDSGPLPTRPFRLVGVTWAKSAVPSPPLISVRTRTQNIWTEWQTLTTETMDAPDPRAEESAGDDVRQGTQPLYAGLSDGVQVRVLPSQPELPTDLRIELIDPGLSTADVSVLPLQSAAATREEGAKPAIIPRARWGADESIRRCCPKYGKIIKAAFVHHTASSTDYQPAESAAMVRAIYTYHVRSRGWDDIGYNFLVDRFGQIFEGRAGGMDKPVVGAHASGFNTDSFGVAALGTYEKTPPPKALLRGLQQVLTWKLGLNQSDPLGTASFLPVGASPSTRPTQLPVIAGHRDAGRTLCPGAQLYQKLPALRAEVKAALTPSTPTKPKPK